MMWKTNRLIACVFTVLAASAAWAANDVLVGRWDFDEGTGDVLRDTSGNANHGEIHGAEWVKVGQGGSLRFDGVDDWIHVPSSKSLDSIKSKGTVELWYRVSANAGFPGILSMKVPGVNWTDMRLVMFVRNDERLFAYVSNGNKYTSASGPVTRDKWAHVAVTWDGKRMKAYANGVLTGENPCTIVPEIAGLSLWIGRTEGTTTPAYFKGQIDDLAIYNEALDNAAILQRFKTHAALLKAGGEAVAPVGRPAELEGVAKFVPIKYPGAVMKGGENLSVKVGTAGALQIDAGPDSYVVESCFPYPGPNRKIGWNGLPRAFTIDTYPDVTKQLGAEAGWAPKVKRLSVDTVTVEAQGKCYRLHRTVKVAEGRIDIHDRLTNLRNVPTGMVPRHRVTANHDYSARRSVGLEVAANPTIFLKGAHGSLGLVLQDNVSRRRFRPWLPPRGNRAGVQINRVVLDKGATRTFSWSLYVMKEGEGYFDFINRLRKDWNANFTIQGPYAFVYIDDADGNFRFETSNIQWKLEAVRRDPSKLRDYLKWKGAKIFALTPWLDYDPAAWDHVLSRAEYEPLMRKFISVIKQVDPEIRCIGCIETPYVTIYPDRIKDGDKLPRAKVGEPTGLLNKELTMEQVRIIESGAQQWKDSFIRSADGKLFYEIYVRGGKPIEPAIRVYPQVGNGQYRFLMDQVRFLLDEVGMDGVYFDMFALGQVGSMRTYTGEWDGVSADVSFSTGEIYGKYVDCSIAAIDAKVNLINYLFSRGKIVVANRHSTSREEQSLPVNRFTEAGWSLAKMDWKLGEKPPAINYLFFGHLNSPIGLAIANAPGEEPNAQRLMKGLIAYLRHGQVYYHHALREFPRTGPRGGGFGPMNHMFPITPVRLFEGGIEGKERTITCLSGTYMWNHEKPPRIFLFDEVGRQTKHDFTPERTGKGWKVAIKLRDWVEIAVIEQL